MARTVTSAARLLDVVPLLADDFRIQVLFTVDNGSAFNDGVADCLRDVGARVVPWRQAVRTPFDLAISASANGKLHKLRAPLLVMPHGVGHNRLVEAATGSRDVASGLARKQLMRFGRVVPDAVVLSHEEQLGRLTRTCPKAADRAVVVGDISFDRMVASLSLRGIYREALGVENGQLVVITSTWGANSLFGKHPHLLAKWVSELPVDRFRTALIMHPNVWYWHGSQQIETWVAEARNAGLILVPPREGWRAALIAADWIIGDHGSVTFYGAALNQPTLLAAFGSGELDPASPLAAFGETAPRLNAARSLHDQLENLTATAVPADVLSRPGEAAEILRTVMYRLMKLPPPEVPPRALPIPSPAFHRPRVSALLVDGFVRDDLVVIDRRPATMDTALRVRVGSPASPDPHLVVEEEETDRRLLESAMIFLRRSEGSQAWDWAAGTLARYPGALIAAVAERGNRSLILIRGGGKLEAVGADTGLCASAIYMRLVEGLPLEGTMTIRAGAHEIRRVEVHPPPA